MHKVLIAPSILSADFSRLGEQIKTVERAGADWLHIDVMDGHFVPNLTVGPAVVHCLRKTTSLFLDAHLMIEEPEKYIPVFAKAGANSITFHYEACKNKVKKVIRQIKKLGKSAGIALRPKTPANVLFPFLKDLDLVLVMTVEPGFGGQKFMPAMLSKIRELRSYCLQKNLNVKIEVDGGINAQTAPATVRAGARVLVAGNSIFGEKSHARALHNLRQSVTRGNKEEKIIIPQKRRAMSTEKAREVKLAGHQAETDFANLIGGSLYLGSRKRDVVDRQGNIHSVKSGQKKWQVFLYGKKRFEQSVGFPGARLFIECIDSFPIRREEYILDKTKFKIALQPKMRALKNFISRRATRGFAQQQNCFPARSILS